MSSRLTTVCTVVTVAAVATAAAALLLRRDPPAAAPPPPPIAAGAGHLAAEVARLRAEVAAVRLAPAAVVAPAAVLAESSAPVDDVPPADRDETLAHLDHALDGELADPAWSATTEAAITAIVGAHATGSHVDGVRCRATLCRLEVRHESDLAAGGFLRRVLTYPPFDGAGMAVPTGDPARPDDRRTVVYLARRDHALPL